MDTYLSFGVVAWNSMKPLSVEPDCTNQNLPLQLPLAPSVAPVKGTPGKNISCAFANISAVTASYAPPLQQGFSLEKLIKQTCR